MTDSQQQQQQQEEQPQPPLYYTSHQQQQITMNDYYNNCNISSARRKPKILRKPNPSQRYIYNKPTPKQIESALITSPHLAQKRSYSYSHSCSNSNSNFNIDSQSISMSYKSSFNHYADYANLRTATPSQSSIISSRSISLSLSSNYLHPNIVVNDHNDHNNHLNDNQNPNHIINNDNNKSKKKNKFSSQRHWVGLKYAVKAPNYHKIKDSVKYKYKKGVHKIAKQLPSMPSMPSLPSIPSIPSMPSMQSLFMDKCDKSDKSDKSDSEKTPTKKYQTMKNLPKKTKQAIDRIRMKKKTKSCTNTSDSGHGQSGGGCDEFDVLSDDENENENEDEPSSVIMNKNKNNPWFNEDIASIVKLCRKYRRKHHKSKTKKNELKQICKELEKKKRKLIRAAKQKWNETQKFVRLNNNNNNQPKNNNNNNINEAAMAINTNIMVSGIDSIDPPTPPLLTPEPQNQNITDPVCHEIYTMIRDNTMYN